MVVHGINFLKMKSWIITHKVPFFIAVLGIIGGYLYWNFIGCSSGNCGITANWHSSMGFGAIMGWLIGDIVNDKLKK